MRVLAVDFGTSTTVAALSVDGGPVRLVTLDGSTLMPSAVFLTSAGTLAVGRDAERQSRLDPSRYEPNPKRRVDEAELMLGTSAFPIEDVIGDVLRHVGDEVVRQLGAPADEVRLTHPARWGSARRKVLVAAARQAGLVPDGVEPILIPEPVAAASHFASGPGSINPGSTLAVYDLGAGTFDVAVLKKGDSGWEVLSEAGLPDLGGLDFEHAIVRHIAETRGKELPDEWAELMQPSAATSRRVSRAFTQDVKDAKESLSRFPQTDVAMPEPFRDVHLTRAEFESLIRPQLQRSTELLAAQIDRAGLIPKDLSGVYLVGGSSRIPLVAKLIQQGLGITPSTLDQPETSVASGAILTSAPTGAGTTVPGTAGGSTGTLAATSPIIPPLPPPPAVELPPVRTDPPWQEPPAADLPVVDLPAVDVPAAESAAAPVVPALEPLTGRGIEAAEIPRPRSDEWVPAPQGLGRPPQAAGGPWPGYLPPSGPPPAAQRAGYGHGGYPVAGSQAGKRKAGIAALVAALVAVTIVVIVAVQGGEPEAGQGNDAASSTDSAAVDQYSEYFPGYGDYLNSTMDDFASCEKDDPAQGVTTCVMKDDLTLTCAIRDSAGYDEYLEPMYGDGKDQSGQLTSDYSATTWTPPTLSSAMPFATFLRANPDSEWEGDKPGIYWHYPGIIVCVYSEPENTEIDITSAELQDRWDTLFKHN